MTQDISPAPSRIAAVLVTYNRLDRLRETLPLLLDSGPARVVVVDNAATDGTAEFLAAQDDPRLKILTMAENCGGAGGFEAGMNWLIAEEEPDWILLLDDDAWPEREALSIFAETASALPPDTGAVAAAVFSPNGSPAEMNRPGHNPFWHPGMIWATLTRGNRAGFKQPDKAYIPAPGPAANRLVEIDTASFVGFFVSREGWRKAGLPEGGLFIYGDDILYSLRLRRAGLRMFFDPATRFVHDCGSMDQNFVYHPLWKIYYHCRNGVDIARASAGPLIFPLALAWYVVIWARRARHAAPAQRPAYRRLMWIGIRDGLLRRRGRMDEVHRMAAVISGTDRER
ncbi:glycosyltransferase [Paracoccus methylarcula]|uniref:glycosyltransferase n=1 Tax=Paracoccus methylarcula TaxID=72022 RepID=UPI0014742DBB|nr:glycosyltransferase [Paracoccus methylarcula]